MPDINHEMLLDSRLEGNQFWNDYSLRALLHTKVVNSWGQCPLPPSGYGLQFSLKEKTIQLSNTLESQTERGWNSKGPEIS